MDIEIRHLRALVALADHGSHTAAARAIHLSQPTLTRTVRQFETVVGASLVEQGSATFTPAGHAVIDRARRVLAELEAMRGDIGSRHAVRLGFSWLLPETWFRDVRIAMARQGVVISISRFDDPMAALVAGDVDISLHRNPIISPPDGISVATIGTERRVLAVSEYDDAFPADGPVSWKSLPDRPVVVNAVSGSTTVDSLPDKGNNREIVECRNFDEWMESVAAGVGIGIVPDICARRIQHPHLRYIELSGAPNSQLRLAWRSTPPPPQIVRRFVDESLCHHSCGS